MNFLVDPSHYIRFYRIKESQVELIKSLKNIEQRKRIELLVLESVLSVMNESMKNKNNICSEYSI